MCRPKWEARAAHRQRMPRVASPARQVAHPAVGRLVRALGAQVAHVPADADPAVHVRAARRAQVAQVGGVPAALVVALGIAVAAPGSVAGGQVDATAVAHRERVAIGGTPAGASCPSEAVGPTSGVSSARTCRASRPAHRARRPLP